jgi:hypothetical protein
VRDLDGVWIGDWICSRFIHTTQDYRQYSAAAIQYTLQFTLNTRTRVLSHN